MNLPFVDDGFTNVNNNKVLLLCEIIYIMQTTIRILLSQKPLIFFRQPLSLPHSRDALDVVQCVT